VVEGLSRPGERRGSALPSSGVSSGVPFDWGNGGVDRVSFRLVTGARLRATAARRWRAGIHHLWARTGDVSRRLIRSYAGRRSGAGLAHVRAELLDVDLHRVRDPHVPQPPLMNQAVCGRPADLQKLSDLLYREPLPGRAGPRKRGTQGGQTAWVLTNPV